MCILNSHLSRKILSVILFFFLVSSVSVGALPLAFAAVPDAPTNLRPSTSPTTTSIFLEWNTPASDGGETITGYKIESAQETGYNEFNSYIVLVANTGSTGTTHTVSGLSSGDFFKFKVSAINASGAGTTSNEFMIGSQHGTEDFSNQQQQFSGGQKFGEGSKFAESQDFDEEGVDHDFSGVSMEYGKGSDFAANETFGDAGDFDAGVQLFDGANTFGKDSKFAASQTFAATQTFDGTNTFGTGTEFAFGQDFSTAGTATSNAVTVDVLSNTAVDTIDEVLSQAVLIDGFNGSANTGNFETGVITVIYTDNSAGDTYEEYAFTDADLDGVIDTGELSNTNHDSTTAFAAGGTIEFTQYDTQNFDAGAQIFGDSMKFNANQKFSEDVQTFGIGTQFTGNADFNAGQTFTTSTTFDDGQEFSAVTDVSTAFNSSGITFGAETPILFADDDLTFGAQASFPKNQDFSAGFANDFSADDINFKEGTVFHASETFGTHVDFEGAITFPDAIDMPTGAEFAAQTFANGSTPAFDDFSTFADNTVFEDTAIIFEENTHFEGATTFADSSTHTFKEGTVFDGALTLTANTHITYDGDSIDFGPSSNLSAKVQDFASGATATIPQFGAGTTFADTQALPFGSVLSTGILLTAITCGTDTSSETCLPTADSAILTKGEIITPGTTAPPAIKNTISKDDTTVSIDGLGVSVDFTSVATDGNLSVAIQDPDVTVANTGAMLSGDSGALAFVASGKSITTVSSVIDFDLTGSTASSGPVTITLPYDESAATAAGFNESNLEVSHFVGGEWVVENNCTVDTVNNDITCIVDSVE